MLGRRELVNDKARQVTTMLVYHFKIKGMGRELIHAPADVAFSATCDEQMQAQDVGASELPKKWQDINLSPGLRTLIQCVKD
jgi:hypothetical protein